MSEHTCGEGSTYGYHEDRQGSVAYLLLDGCLVKTDANRELNRECDHRVMTAAHKTRVTGVVLTHVKVSQPWFPFTRQEKGASQEAHIYSRVAQLVRAAAL